MDRYIHAEHGNFAVRIPQQHADDLSQADVATYYSDGSDSYDDIPECCWVPWGDSDELAPDTLRDLENALAIATYERTQGAA